jgi:hypothetical protein
VVVCLGADDNRNTTEDLPSIFDGLGSFVFMGLSSYEYKSLTNNNKSFLAWFYTPRIGVSLAVDFRVPYNVSFLRQVILGRPCRRYTQVHQEKQST